MSIIEKAVEKYGVKQITICMEECAELIQALSKELRGRGDIDNISEEIADVEIMLEQMKLLFNNNIDVTVWKAYKLNRLEERMKDNDNWV